MHDAAKVKLSTPIAVHIPDKVYFRIGEVGRLVGVDTHVLRYWETEFTQIRPFRGKAKQRLYRRRDVEQLLLVKELLHTRGYTISGARKHLRDMERGAADCQVGAAAESPEPSAKILLQAIKSELRTILAQLGRRDQDDG